MNIFAAAGLGPALMDSQTRQLQTGTRGQGSVNVGHEGLRLRDVVPRPLHLTTGGLRLSQRQADINSTRDNVPGHHT